MPQIYLRRFVKLVCIAYAIAFLATILFMSWSHIASARLSWRKEVLRRYSLVNTILELTAPEVSLAQEIAIASEQSAEYFRRTPHFIRVTPRGSIMPSTDTVEFRGTSPFDESTVITGYNYLLNATVELEVVASSLGPEISCPTLAAGTGVVVGIGSLLVYWMLIQCGNLIGKGQTNSGRALGVALCYIAHLVPFALAAALVFSMARVQRECEHYATQTAVEGTSNLFLETLAASRAVVHTRMNVDLLQQGALEYMAVQFKNLFGTMDPTYTFSVFNVKQDGDIEPIVPSRLSALALRALKTVQTSSVSRNMIGSLTPRCTYLSDQSTWDRSTLEIYLVPMYLSGVVGAAAGGGPSSSLSWNQNPPMMLAFEQNIVPLSSLPHVQYGIKIGLWLSLTVLVGAWISFPQATVGAVLTSRLRTYHGFSPSAWTPQMKTLFYGLTILILALTVGSFLSQENLSVNTVSRLTDAAYQVDFQMSDIAEATTYLALLTHTVAGATEWSLTSSSIQPLFQKMLFGGLSTTGNATDFDALFSVYEAITSAAVPLSVSDRSALNLVSFVTAYQSAQLNNATASVSSQQQGSLSEHFNVSIVQSFSKAQLKLSTEWFLLLDSIGSAPLNPGWTAGPTIESLTSIADVFDSELILFSIEGNSSRFTGVRSSLSRQFLSIVSKAIVGGLNSAVYASAVALFDSISAAPISVVVQEWAALIAAASTTLATGSLSSASAVISTADLRPQFNSPSLALEKWVAGNASKMQQNVVRSTKRTMKHNMNLRTSEYNSYIWDTATFIVVSFLIILFISVAFDGWYLYFLGTHHHHSNTVDRAAASNPAYTLNMRAMLSAVIWITFGAFVSLSISFIILFVGVESAKMDYAEILSDYDKTKQFVPYAASAIQLPLVAIQATQQCIRGSESHETRSIKNCVLLLTEFNEQFDALNVALDFRGQNFWTQDETRTSLLAAMKSRNVYAWNMSQVVLEVAVDLAESPNDFNSTTSDSFLGMFNVLSELVSEVESLPHPLYTTNSCFVVNMSDAVDPTQTPLSQWNSFLSRSARLVQNVLSRTLPYYQEMDNATSSNNVLRLSAELRAVSNTLFNFLNEINASSIQCREKDAQSLRDKLQRFAALTALPIVSQETRELAWLSSTRPFTSLDQQRGVVQGSHAALVPWAETFSVFSTLIGNELTIGREAAAMTSPRAAVFWSASLLLVALLLAGKLVERVFRTLTSLAINR